jgi:patatin-related protein
MKAHFPTGSADSVTKEYRFAVVMYGGISLAVYMNGIAQELLSLVRSTALENRKDDQSRMLDDLKSTEAIYRDLAVLLSEEDDSAVHVRFLIDIVSGTSAGGINGIFLAKALTARKDMESLKQTWIKEADFGLLLNDDKGRLEGLPQQVPPRSLLNGERMYVKLFEALAEMDDVNPKQSYVDELNLWVTTTDLAGKVIPLRLSDRVVWEREHRQAFNFQYDESQEPPPEDFEAKNTPFLAFAARCTSSFPVAFEPMQLASITRLLPVSRKYTRNGPYNQKVETWQNFFGQDDAVIPDTERFFADGGYLDNHPFDRAIEALNRQSSHIRSVRKLLYIEPSPEHPELERRGLDGSGKAIQPDAIENAWAGLAGIPGKQPIRDSLLQIQKRNRLIRKVNEVILEISDAVESSAITQQSQKEADEGLQVDPDSSAQRTAFQERVGYRAYVALNAYAVTDDLAIRIARLSRIDDTSDFVYAIRCLVKVWRKRHYPDERHSGDGRMDKFLLDFDISYRMRRYQFVKSQLELLSALGENAKARLVKLNERVPESGAEKKSFRDAIARVRREFDKSFRVLRNASRLAQTSDDLKNAVRALQIGKEELNDILGVGFVKSDPDNPAPLPVVSEEDYDIRAKKYLTPDRERAMNALAEKVRASYGEAMGEAKLHAAAILKGGQEPTVLRLARLYYFGFQEFDAAIFPITYGTDVGELETVDVLRVSPEDATAILKQTATGTQKLAGTTFGSFGAFLEEVWRRNDILWGRLDGAERIIFALAPTKDVKGMIRRAHEIIVQEELDPAARAEICQMFVDTLLSTGKGPVTEQRKREVLKTIRECVAKTEGSTDINPKLAAVLRQALTPEQILRCLGSYQISREPNRERMLRNVARSSRVIGQMLQGMADRRTELKRPGSLLLQAGNVLWGMVEAAIPETPWSVLSRYWFGLLLLFGFVMFIGGTLFRVPGQTLGIEIVMVAVAARVTIAGLRSYIRGNWQRFVRIAVGAVIFGMLVLSFIELRNLHAELGDLTKRIQAWVADLLIMVWRKLAL